MTTSKHEMIIRFLNGKNGKASREESKEVNGYRTIVGYGWAVYVLDFENEYLLFGDGYKTRNDNVGWAGYSGQTTQHMQEIKGMLEENGLKYTVVDYQLRVNELQNFDNPQKKLRQIAEENEVEPAEGGGYTVTLKR